MWGWALIWSIVCKFFYIYYECLLKFKDCYKIGYNILWNIIIGIVISIHFSSVQSLSLVQLFATPWTAAHQASLSITNFQSLLKFMSIESVMPSNHLILCRPPLILPSIFLSIRVFSNKSAPHTWCEEQVAKGLEHQL